ncbi:MAG TPA: AAA family ATPase [Drouetiella sp.]
MKQKVIALVTSRPARIALPLAIILIGFTLTFLQTRMQKPTFTASARIWVPAKLFFMGRDGDATAESQQASALTTGPNALRTACEIIHSDAVTKLTYEDLQSKLGANCPSEGAIQSGVRAHPVESTDILEVSYSGMDSDSTLAVLQSVIDAFFKENNNQVVEPLLERKKRLEQQLKVAQDQYSKVKNKVKTFQDSTSFIDLQADVAQLNAQKQDLEKTLEESRHELTSVKGRLEYARKQLGFGPESVVAVQKLAEDEIMRSLRSHIAETEVALIGLRSKYQDEHPKVKRLRASLEEAQKGLDARYMQIVGKPGLQNVVVGNSSISGGSSLSSSSSGGADGASKGLGGGISESAQARMISEMAESSTTIASLEAKISSLSSSLGQIRSKLSSVPAREMEFADIHRADDLATTSLTSIERELQRIKLSETAGLNSQGSMQIIDNPTISNTSTPNTFVLGAMVSLILAAAAAVGQFLLLPKTVTASKLSAIFPARIAGLIPSTDKSRNSAKAIVSSVDRVRLSLEDWFSDGKAAVPIVLTSGDRGDGKSTVAYALSVCLAENGAKVLLIDCDTVTPSIHRLASISASPGLLQYIDEPTAEPFEYMQAVRENLTIIPAGGVSEESCLKEPRLKRLIAELGKHFDAIIVDAPDCGETLDSLLAPSFACRWLAVVRLNKTLTKHVQNMAAQLEMMPMESALVVNDVIHKDIDVLRQGSRNTNTAKVATTFDPSQSNEEDEAAVW